MSYEATTTATVLAEVDRQMAGQGMDTYLATLRSALSPIADIPVKRGLMVASTIDAWQRITGIVLPVPAVDGMTAEIILGNLQSIAEALAGHCQYELPQ